MITEPKLFTAIRLPQRFQYCRRDGKHQWLDGVCIPISDGRWKVMWFDQDGCSGQSRVISVIAANPPSIPLSNGPHWLHRWIDNDCGWCNENTTDMRCCGQLFRDTDELRDHIFNNHNPYQQEPTMTFPERDGDREFVKQQAYIARERSRFDPEVDAARKAEAARLAAIEREAEVCAMAKDLLLNMVAGDKQTPFDFLSDQAFTLADRFYAERDRRSAAIK